MGETTAGAGPEAGQAGNVQTRMVAGGSQAAAPLRPLTDIYEELGRTLLALGRECQRDGRPDQAKQRFAEAAQAYRDAIGTSPDSAALYESLAEARIAQERFSDALQAYLDAVRRAPRAAAALLPRAHDLLTPELARSLAEAVNSWFETPAFSGLDGAASVAVHLFMGRNNLYRGQTAQAAAHFQEALAVQPNNLFALEGLGESCRRAGDKEQAVEHLGRALTQAQAEQNRDRVASVSVRLARILRDSGEYDEALRMVEQGLPLSQKFTAEFQVIRSQCSQALGRSDEALSAADAALALDDTLAAAHVARAAALCSLRQYKAADEAAKTALTLEPTNGDAIRLRAEALILGGLDLEQGLRLLQIHLKQQPADLARRRLLIETLRVQERPAREVVEAIKQALASAPDAEQPPLQLELAEAYLKTTENAPDAIDALEEAARRAPHLRTARWWRLSGAALQQAGRLDEAAHSYRNAWEQDETDLDSLEKWAELVEGRGELAAAEGAWRRLVERAPEEMRARLRLARNLCRQRELEEALATVEQVLAKSRGVGTEAEAYELKAQLLEALQRPADAVAEAYFEAGDRRISREEYQAAAAMFERAKQFNPEHAPTYWAWSEALRLSSGKLSTATEDKAKFEAEYEGLIRESLKVWDAAPARPNADSSWAYVNRALLNYSSNHLPLFELWGEALAYLERAILLSSRDPIRWATLGDLHGNLQMMGSALHATATALKYDGDSVYALDRRARVLANAGLFQEAEELTAKRLSLEPDPWADGVMAYIYSRTERYQEALKLLPDSLEDAWTANLRATCHSMAGRSSLARQEYEKVWLRYEQERDKIWRRRTPTDRDNQLVFGIAAFYLYLMGRTELGDEAARLLTDLVEEPLERKPGAAHSYLSFYHLAQGRLEEAEQHFAQGLELVASIRELEDIRRFDLKELDKAAVAWPHADEAVALLARFEEAIAVREADFEKPTEPVAELEELASALPHEGAADGWLSVAADAALARFYAEQKRWRDAARKYQHLQKQAERFPEAIVGLSNTVDELQAEGVRLANENQREAALEHFTASLEIARESLPDDRVRHADLCAQIGYVDFELGRLAEHRAHFTSALAFYRASEQPEPGAALGAACQQLLSSGAKYWALKDELADMAAAAEADEQLQRDLKAAQEALDKYLIQSYQLAAPGADTLPPPVVLPVVLELGPGLEPVDSGPEWPLLKTFIPDMRVRIQTELGVYVPGVRIRMNTDELPGAAYLILLDEIPVVIGAVEPQKRFCTAAPAALRELGLPAESLTEAENPLTGAPGCWVGQDYWQVLTEHGLGPLADPLEYTTWRLEALLRRNLASFLGLSGSEYLLGVWGQDEEARAFIKAAVPDGAALFRLSRVLRALAAERVPITRWRDILETLQATAADSKDCAEAVRAVRLRLRTQLPGNQPGANHLLLPAELEGALDRGLRREGGKTFLAMLPEVTQDIISKLRELVDAADKPAVLVTRSGELRPHVRRVVELEFPDWMVLSQEELLSPDGQQIAVSGAGPQE